MTVTSVALPDLRLRYRRYSAERSESGPSLSALVIGEVRYLGPSPPDGGEVPSGVDGNGRSVEQAAGVKESRL